MGTTGAELGRRRPGATITVSAVDDHPAILRGVEATLASDAPDIRLERVAATVAELVDHPPTDLVLLDLRLGDGTRPTQNVEALIGWGATVLVYTDGSMAPLAREALVAGAQGIVGKGDDLAVLIEAIRTVAAGESYESQGLMSVLEGAPEPPGLSEREREVMRLYTSGLPLKSVARRMGISQETVKEYLKRIRQKYLDQGRAASTKLLLYQRAQEDGLVGEDA